MEAMSSTCVSHPFVIGCRDVSAPVTWELVSVDWASPSTVLVLFNEQWSSSRFMCRPGLPPLESMYLYLLLYYFDLY
ncbi:hypothetical protein TIFTF001_006889 [Ficus carica]|uniref:Uncharacterized protein n=1 Tax=Ficus carica TaxID=3494 RepID=A0AA88D1B2_FICCA|nr:hypothetical protein TIFTF001_006889 [Ficus carica]